MRYLLKVLQGHDTAERQLLGAVAASRRKRGTPTSPSGINATYHVVFVDPVPDGYFKPAASLDPLALHRHDQNRLTAVLNECAAWHLAQALGPPYSAIVAPVVFRTVSLDPEPDRPHRTDEEGTIAQHRGDGPGFDAAIASAPEQVLHAGFFDALIGQQDRHQAQHGWDATERTLHLFDHGYAFGGPGARHRNTTFWDYRLAVRPRLTPEEVEIVRRIRDSGDLLGVAPLLRLTSADALWVRANKMVDGTRILPPNAQR